MDLELRTKDRMEIQVWESLGGLHQVLVTDFEVNSHEWRGCQARCTEALTPKGPFVQLWVFWAAPAGITSAITCLLAPWLLPTLSGNSIIRAAQLKDSKPSSSGQSQIPTATQRSIGVREQWGHCVTGFLVKGFRVGPFTS